ncbi:MAG TPA: ATP-grasp domain-containing protein [Methanospirillum sp.]|nr:ATP-grasp domain-containing protein [Methanospirillum sp.]
MIGEINRILVIGFSTRHVAVSASRAGYEVYAIDHFCDLDLRSCVCAYLQFEELAELPDLISQICNEHQIDAIITTSGAEDLSRLPAPLLGTDRAVATRFLDKAETQRFFESHGFPVPGIAPSGAYPAMLKPCRGSGGWRNAVVRSEADIRRWEELFPGEPYILQEIAEGIPASVCCVTTGSSAKAIAVNRQIMRGTEDAPFGFSGSETPFVHPLAGQMRDLAEQIAAASGCRGIIGIDFMVTDQSCVAIEINPRFVGTLDTMERATGLSMVKLHIDACQGILPDSIPDPERCYMRRILFATQDVTIDEDLSFLAPSVADIPAPPASFSPGEAIISVFGDGDDSVGAEASLDKTIRTAVQYIH